jgi:hypothetical protein
MASSRQQAAAAGATASQGVLVQGAAALQPDNTMLEAWRLL